MLQGRQRQDIALLISVWTRCSGDEAKLSFSQATSECGNLVKATGLHRCRCSNEVPGGTKNESA